MGWIAIALCCTAVLATDDNGVIEGVVVNGTRDQEPVPDAVVILLPTTRALWFRSLKPPPTRAGFFALNKFP